MEIFKKLCLVFLGVLLAVGLFCLVVAIACAVNGIGFGEQITQWFGSLGNDPEKVKTLCYGMKLLK